MNLFYWIAKKERSGTNSSYIPFAKLLRAEDEGNGGRLVAFNYNSLVSCSKDCRPGGKRILPRWKSFDCKFAVTSGNSVERVRHDANIRVHPRMIVAGDRNHDFGLGESDAQRRGSRRHRLIPDAVYSRYKMDVVHSGIFGSNFNGLPSHDAKHVRPEHAAHLEEIDWLFRRWKGPPVQPALHIDEGVWKTPVGFHFIIFQVNRILVCSGTHGVLRHGNKMSLRPCSLKTHSARDFACRRLAVGQIGFLPGCRSVRCVFCQNLTVRKNCNQEDRDESKKYRLTWSHPKPSFPCPYYGAIYFRAPCHECSGQPEIPPTLQILACEAAHDSPNAGLLRGSTYSTCCKFNPIRIPLTKTTEWLMTSWLVTSALANCRSSGSGEINSMASDASLVRGPN